MSESRVGLGVDVHPFVSQPSGDDNRVLVLGGIQFSGERPLEGHSDADVVAHALSEAMLGAAGLGDLGMHFPDTDPKWHGADSLMILEHCKALVAKDRWHLTNADCTIVTEVPKIAPSRVAMMEKLSAIAGGPVHVKATRPEGLGALGRVEGIACLAVVLLER